MLIICPWVSPLVSFRQVSPPKPCTCLFSPPMHHMPCYLILLDFITCTTLGEQYRSLSSSLCSFLHSPVTSSLLGPSILFNTLFSNTFSLHSSLNVSDQVSHPYKTTGKITHVPLLLLRSFQSISAGPWLCPLIFRNKIRFNREGFSAPCPIPMLEDRPLSAVRDCLFNMFAATLHIAGRSSICNLRTRHAVVTGTHLSHGPKSAPARISILCGVTVGCWQLMSLDIVHSNSSLLWTYVHQLTNMSANRQFSFGSIAFFCLRSDYCAIV